MKPLGIARRHAIRAEFNRIEYYCNKEFPQKYSKYTDSLKSSWKHYKRREKDGSFEKSSGLENEVLAHIAYFLAAVEDNVPNKYLDFPLNDWLDTLNRTGMPLDITAEFSTQYTWEDMRNGVSPRKAKRIKK